MDTNLIKHSSNKANIADLLEEPPSSPYFALQIPTQVLSCEQLAKGSLQDAVGRHIDTQFVECAPEPCRLGREHADAVGYENAAARRTRCLLMHQVPALEASLVQRFDARNQYSCEQVQ